MDTTLAVIKRIEQQLTQLERELQRNGFEMPYESFIVHTGDGVRVEVSPDAPPPAPKEQPKKRPVVTKVIEPVEAVSSDEPAETDG
jgi:hypothetical protein